ncbi:MAG: S28 family serine protease [Kofleriaceae bacterium]|nr:S28 family serine protease [Kofleriaceae bacterium]
MLGRAAQLPGGEEVKCLIAFTGRHGKLAAMLRVLLAAALLSGCGDNLQVEPGPDPAFLDRLNALPGVTAVEASTETTGYTFYEVTFRQPVDHEAPSGPTFAQTVSLLHASTAAPMVVFTTGYWDYYRDTPSELARLLSANQVSIEHRFFGTSRPEPADWSKLTIKQMADDEHAIIEALRTLYGGAFVTTGGSKGGMTAVYHRRFYPDDVEATVPYVAPLSFGAPDGRYAPFLDTIGPDDCRQKVRDAATEMLANRRAAMLQRATDQAAADGHSYTRVAIGPAVESSISSLEWAFWQYYGVGACNSVPVASATDDELWAFLDEISPVADNDDDQIGAFDAYYYQAYAQLGYPDGGADYLDPHLMYADADYAGSLPTEEPAYDGGAAMRDIDQWVQSEGRQLLFLYGEWDPWTGGAFELGNAQDSLRVTQAQGTHGARIGRLAAADQDAVNAKLAAWTGVIPLGFNQRSRELDLVRPEPRVPPGIHRALRARGKLAP